MRKKLMKTISLFSALCMTACSGSTVKNNKTAQTEKPTSGYITDTFAPETDAPVDDTWMDNPYREKTEYDDSRTYTDTNYGYSAVKGISFDSVEEEYYLQVRQKPMDIPAVSAETQKGVSSLVGDTVSKSLCLDGNWQMIPAVGSESYYYTEEMLPDGDCAKLNIVGLPVTVSSQYIALGDNLFKGSGINDGAFNVDGEDDWVSAGPATDAEPWFIIDLTEVRSVNGFVLYNFGALGVFDGSDRPENTRAFTVSVSTDGKKWTEIYSTENNTLSVVDVKLDKYYDARYVTVDLDKTEQTAKGYARIVEFELYGKGKVFTPAQIDWTGAYTVPVPGSVSGALYEAGIIDDPYFGHNDAAAREAAGKTWWMKKEFEFTPTNGRMILSFDGICDRVDVWINNEYLGFHQGMYGGPEFDISRFVRKGANTVVVRLYPAVGNWAETVAFNISYGWTQVNIPPLGIWQSVHVDSLATVVIENPFIAAADTNGNMNFYCELNNTKNGTIEGMLVADIIPKNFEGTSCHWSQNIKTESNSATLRYTFSIPDPRLWWPNGIGEQNLYLLKLRFVDTDGKILSEKTVQFGIRTVEMRPLADVGEYSDVYNWTFAINGQKVFLHGCNWYPCDVLMNYTEDHYERIISLARNQGVQLFRAWGNGMVETDKFYDFCDEYGICVYQEWPISWDSYNTQPKEVLYETAEINTRRLRNRASLIMWGGGNEGIAGLTENILNEVGRITVENDGTRPWHRTDPFGDASHLYDTYMGGMPLEENFTYESPFIGEFGIPSLPMRESIEKYASEDEISEWPISHDNTLSYHSVAFGSFESILAKGDLENIKLYAEEFLKIDSLDDLILGSQLAQSVGLIHTLQRARANFPSSTGICYYKFDDIYPCTTWAPVDYYGTPKMTYYMIQDVYQPIAAVALFENASYYGQNAKIPVYLLDDACSLNGKEWQVNARVYNAALDCVWRKSVTGNESSISKYLFDIGLTPDLTASAPLFFVTETVQNGEIVSRNYYFLNYNDSQGCLFRLPATTVDFQKEGNAFRLTNTGSVPAVAVSFDCSSVSDTFLPTDNYIWLEAGESVLVNVNSTEGITGVSFWNKAESGISVNIATPSGLEAHSDSWDTVTVKWDNVTDARGYYVYSDGKRIASVTDSEYTVIGLKENEFHSYSVSSYDGCGNESLQSVSVSVGSKADTTPPAVLEWRMISENEAELVFSKDMDPTAVKSKSNYTISGGASVKSVEYDEKTRTASLTLSGISGCSDYRLTVSGVKDTTAAGNKITQTGTVAVGLMLYWDFNAGNGYRLYDVTGNAGIGTLLTDKVVFEDSGKNALGYAVNFDGTVSSISIRKSYLPLERGFTLSAFVKCEAVSDVQQTILARNIYPISGFMNFTLYQGKPMFYSADLSPRVNFIGQKNVCDGKWHQVGVTYDGSNLIMYVDGENVGNYTGISGEIRRDNCEWAIGRLVRNINRFSGSIDEVRVYNRAISSSEMKMLSDSVK